MIHISEIVVVEGKYDRIALERLTDATVLETSGFGIFKEKALQKTLRNLAEKRGLIILTDSDSAGFAIRHFLNGIIDNRYIKNVYIPDVYGKERRKKDPSKEGKLGVEGMDPATLERLLLQAGVQTEKGENVRAVTKTDLYRLGLTGGERSAEKRICLQKMLELPEKLSANRFLELLNVMMTYEDFIKLTEQMGEDYGI